MKGIVRKTEVTDYENFYTGRINTGRAWHIQLDSGLEMFLPISWTKSRVREFVESQVGGVHLTQWAVLPSDRKVFI